MLRCKSSDASTGCALFFLIKMFMRQKFTKIDFSYIFFLFYTEILFNPANTRASSLGAWDRDCVHAYLFNLSQKHRYVHVSMHAHAVFLVAFLFFMCVFHVQESVDGDTEEMRLYIVFKSSPPECNWSPNVTYELVMQRGDQVHTFMLLLSALYSLKSRLRFSYKYKALDRDGRELWSSPFSEM